MPAPHKQALHMSRRTGALTTLPGSFHRQSSVRNWFSRGMQSVRRNLPPTLTQLEVFRLLDDPRGADLVDEQLERTRAITAPGGVSSRWMTEKKLREEMKRSSFDSQVHKGQPFHLWME